MPDLESGEGYPTELSPFHDGELALQRRAGVDARIDALGRRLIRDYMPEQHREFFTSLPTVVLAAVDEAGQPWATMLAGPPGFVSAPDDRHLRIEAGPAGAGDPLVAGLARGDAVGLLGLQPHTRRRNRMNGTIIARDASGFSVRVRQSFGNCPKYIQAREPQWDAGLATSSPAVGSGPRLTVDAVRRIRAADTFFVASRSTAPRAAQRSEGLDVSHRGGRPGFVRVDDAGHESVLTIPDFVGNFLFNTLGNLLLQPACGLLFVDYGDGSLLHVNGDAEIIWDGAEVAACAGAERLWRVHVRAALWRPQALPLHWSAPSFAPQLAEPAGWEEVPSRPEGGSR